MTFARQRIVSYHLKMLAIRPGRITRRQKSLKIEKERCFDDCSLITIIFL